MYLNDKNIVIIGVANERSIASFIAKDMQKKGANIALSFLNEKLQPRVEALAKEVHADYLAELDVLKEGSVKNFFQGLEKKWNRIDGIVHSIAFANKEDLEGRFIDTSAEGFSLALRVSAHSLLEITKHAEAQMREGGSVITLSYIGSQKVIPNYNLMGVAKAALEASARYMAYDLGPKKIRVNAISAGPIKTLSAAGIRDFRKMLSSAAESVPLKENISGESVAAMASFLASDEAKHITGECIYVDSGAHIL
tara:strand:+ start:5771 stop:6529 length:759 start_codon:yes stop_codon:yes gene_type:complete